MSPFAGIIQIKFNRMISERQEPDTGLHASGFGTGCTLISRQYHATRLHDGRLLERSGIHIYPGIKSTVSFQVSHYKKQPMLATLLGHRVVLPV